jgi:hypothetical protein
LCRKWLCWSAPWWKFSRDSLWLKKR